MGCRIDHRSQLLGRWPVAVPRSGHPLQCAAPVGSPRLPLVALPAPDPPSLALVPWPLTGNDRAPRGTAHLVPDHHPGDSGTVAGDAPDGAPAADASAPTGVHRAAGGLGGQRMDPPDPRWRPLAPGMAEQTTTVRRWVLPQWLPGYGQRSF